MSAKKGGLKPILEAIKEAARSGDNECWIYENIDSAERKELKMLGYKVGKTEWDQRESGYLTLIKW